MDSLQSPVDYDLHFNTKYLNLQDNVELKSLTFSYSNMREKMLCFYSKNEKLSDEDPVLIENVTKQLGKKVD